MSDIFVIWRDPQTTMLEPVAKVCFSEEKYWLSYTKGALNTRFSAFPRMDLKEKKYSSTDLFPFFKNRLISDRRPEFQKLLSWLDMDKARYDPLELLSVTGGTKKTDNFRVVKTPLKTEDNKYRIKFFVSGIAYTSTEAKEAILNLSRGESLSYEFENNKNDLNAITIACEKSSLKLGYYPRYLNEDLKKLINLNSSGLAPSIKVIKVNPDAPDQYRLLCETISDWPKNFKPFESEKYETISNNEC